MSTRPDSPNAGVIATCSLDSLGVIDVEEPQEVDYGDGNSAEAWTGVHLTDEVSEPGEPWSSRSPDPIGHAEDLRAAFDALYGPHGSAFLILYAVRYALGRNSYAVGEVTDYLTEHWSAIPKNTRYYIQTEIQDRLGREVLFDDGRSLLGDRCDRKAWMKILELPAPDNPQPTSS